MWMMGRIRRIERGNDHDPFTQTRLARLARFNALQKRGQSR